MQFRINSYREENERRRLRFPFGDGRIALVTGLGFLFRCMLLRELAFLLGRASWSGLVGEGMLIIGWVAMWRPLKSFFTNGCRSGAAVVHVDLKRSNDDCLRIAVDLADQFGAKLIGITAFTLWVPFEGDGIFPQAVIEELRSQFTKQMTDAEASFRAAAGTRPRKIEWRPAMAWPAD